MDVTKAGATGTTAVAPEFSNSLTLFHQGGGADSVHHIDMVALKFSHSYIPGDIVFQIVKLLLFKINFHHAKIFFI